MAEWRGRDDEPVHPELHGEQVHTDPGDPHHHEDEDTTDQIAARLIRIDPDRRETLAAPANQMEHEEGRREAEDEPEDLARERVGLVGGRDDDAGDRSFEEREDRVGRPSQHREREDDEDLFDERPAVRGRRRDRRRPGTRIRVGLHRRHCTHR